jgi:hypothetical protein
MFVQAIEQALKFTRPIHTIVRYWDTTAAEPNAATLFFINNDGWALTCKHVAHLLFSGINERFKAFKADCAALKANKRSRNAINQIGAKHGFKKGEIVQLLTKLINCVEGKLDLEERQTPRSSRTLHPNWRL